MVKMGGCLFSISKRKNSRLDLAIKKSVIPFRHLMPTKSKIKLVGGSKATPKLHKTISFYLKKIYEQSNRDLLLGSFPIKTESSPISRRKTSDTRRFTVVPCKNCNVWRRC